MNINEQLIADSPSSVFMKINSNSGAGVPYTVLSLASLTGMRQLTVCYPRGFPLAFGLLNAGSAVIRRHTFPIILGCGHNHHY